MSYGLAKKRHEEQGNAIHTDHLHLCRVAGCGRRWSVDISHGRVCGFHDEQFSKAGIQRRALPELARAAAYLGELVKPWCDAERDAE
jgi:hypothetical protein